MCLSLNVELLKQWTGISPGFMLGKEKAGALQPTRVGACIPQKKFQTVSTRSQEPKEWWVSDGRDYAHLVPHASCLSFNPNPHVRTQRWTSESPDHFICSHWLNLLYSSLYCHVENGWLGPACSDRQAWSLKSPGTNALRGKSLAKRKSWRALEQQAAFWIYSPINEEEPT